MGPEERVTWSIGAARPAGRLGRRCGRWYDRDRDAEGGSSAGPEGGREEDRRRCRSYAPLTGDLVVFSLSASSWEAEGRAARDGQPRRRTSGLAADRTCFDRKAS